MAQCCNMIQGKLLKYKYLYCIVTVTHATRILNFRFSPNKALDFAGNGQLLQEFYGCSR